MIQLLLYWLLTAAILLLISAMIPGIAISTFAVALGATLIMGIINLTIKPLIVLLTLPVNILTLGLFSIIINAALFSLAAYLVPGFTVTSFWAALIGSILLALMTTVLSGWEKRYS